MNGGPTLRRIFQGASDRALLTAVFAATRVLLHARGLRFNFELNWMFLCDPIELRTRAFDCVLYFHAYPPGMNLLSSLLLKLGGARPAALALLVFWALGLLLVQSLFYLLRALGLSRGAAFGVAVVFSVIPQTLYFEHLFLWEHIVAACLTAACACLHRALVRGRTRDYVACFGLCALIGWFRGTFHLVWFVVVVALVLFFAGKRELRRVLSAAAVPFALLLGLYVKNAALFGVFGTTSAAGGNLTHVTVEQLDPEVKQRWIAEGKLSPFAALGVYSGPEAYLSFFGPHSDGRSPILDALERPTFHSPNYNHWAMIPVMRTRSHDAAVYVRELPGAYLSTVWHGFLQLFGPATRWHPRTGKPGSPHYEHAKVLGAYENAYNAVVHFGWGIYALLPLPCFWASREVLRGVRSANKIRRARSGVLAFALLQIAFIVVTSALFTIGESARYRHQIEALIWLIAAAALADWLKAQRRSATAGATTSTT